MNTSQGKEANEEGAEDSTGSEDLGAILVVDDDEVLRECIAMALAMEGYGVATAAHGAAALDLVRERRRAGEPEPLVILLDMRMPVMNGWQFVRAYRQETPPHAPIVVVTGTVDAELRAAEVQADAALAKPFDLEDLLRVVDRCTERWRPSQLVPVHAQRKSA